MNNFSKYLSALFLAATLATAVGCASTSKQEGTGEYVDDNVETFKGIVQLSGFVSSQAAINKAVEITRAVGGVKSVKNDMRVK